MGGVALADLASSVTNAGGIGTIGAATLLPLERYHAELKKMRAMARGPWGVDILATTPDTAAMVDLLVQEGAAIFVTGLGTAAGLVEVCHRGGVKVGCVAGQVKHAIAAVEAGCDFVIVQGTEGGGHTGDVSLMPLLPQVIDAVGSRVPVVAAGGIYDGRGLAAALAMGADGVWVGTRFLMSSEACTVPGYKERLLEATSRDTIITAAYTGKPCRVLKNEWTAKLPARLREAGMNEREFHTTLDSDEFLGINHIMGTELNDLPVDLSVEFMPCGQVAGAIRSIEPAHKIVNDMLLGAAAQLERVRRARL